MSHGGAGAGHAIPLQGTGFRGFGRGRGGGSALQLAPVWGMRPVLAADPANLSRLGGRRGVADRRGDGDQPPANGAQRLR